MPQVEYTTIIKYTRKLRLEIFNEVSFHAYSSSTLMRISPCHRPMKNPTLFVLAFFLYN